MLTPTMLLELGYHEFEWNGGSIMEYWKGIRNTDDMNHRIGVRFNEWKDRPFCVYLFFPTVMLELKHIQTITEIECLYALLRQP